MLYLYVLV